MDDNDKKRAHCLYDRYYRFYSSQVSDDYVGFLYRFVDIPDDSCLKDAIAQCLHIDPSKRLTIEALSKVAFFKEHPAS